MKIKMSQVVAIDKGVKQRHVDLMTHFHRLSDKPGLFSGLSKVYLPKDEEGETYPPQSQKVEHDVRVLLEDLGSSYVYLLDTVATRDYGNMFAVADVVIGDIVIIAQAPATYLLWLEKELNLIRTYLSALPELDKAENWVEDPNSGLFKTEATKTERTKKVQKPIVLYPATPEHPAQTQLITEDITVGYWDTIKSSGAIPASRKKVLLERVELLQNAVKSARAEANSTEVEQIKIGKTVISYLFG